MKIKVYVGYRMMPVVLAAICVSVICDTTDLQASEDGNVRAHVKKLLVASTHDNKSFADARDKIVALGETAVPTLISRLPASNPKERANAVTFLGLLKSTNSISYFLARKRDPDINVRNAALEALWQFEDPKLIDSIAESFLSDEHPSVRDLAVIVLGRFKHEKAVPYLVLALDDDDRFARECARAALKEFSGENVPVAESEEELNNNWKQWYKNRQVNKRDVE